MVMNTDPDNDNDYDPAGTVDTDNALNPNQESRRSHRQPTGNLPKHKKHVSKPMPKKTNAR